MSKNNRICHTCNKDYYFCSQCPSEKKKETFYNMFCSERCSDIFKTLTDETFKRLTTAQCKERLLGLNVSVNDDFKEGIKNHIKRVFDYKEAVIENVEVVEVVVEEKEQEITSVIETEIESTEEVFVEEELVENELAQKMEYVPRKNKKARK